MPKGVVQNQASLGVNLFAHIVAGEISASDVMLLSTPLPHSAYGKIDKKALRNEIAEE